MKALLIGMTVLSLIGAVNAEETAGEKVGAVTNDAKRTVKKGTHRASEAICAEGDAKCLGKKVRNRGIEAKDTMADKAEEVKNKIDK